MLNERGGINGRKINLILLDDSYAPPKTVEQTRRLCRSTRCSSCASTARPGSGLGIADGELMFCHSGARVTPAGKAILPIVVMDSGLAASRRPHMRDCASWNDDRIPLRRNSGTRTAAPLYWSSRTWTTAMSSA